MSELLNSSGISLSRVRKKLLLEFDSIDRYGESYKTLTALEHLEKVRERHIQKWIDEGTIELKDIID